MRKEKKKDTYIASGMLTAFVLWTVLIRFADVQAIGPNNTAVGLATVNRFFHNLTGVHLSLYVITDWLSFVPLGFVTGFALLGLGQWVKRKRLTKVDRSILILGVFYIAVYCFFEIFPVNARPVLINGQLEASYPSSTTMLVLCVMSTARMQLNSRIGNTVLRRIVNFAMVAFIVFMVTGRVLSGVHWFTDIVGGALVSAGLIKIYQIFEGI